MAKLSELKQEDNLKVLVYGESGSSKTCFATSFPGPILVHDFDKKIISAANFWQKNNPEQLAQIDYLDYSAVLGEGKDLDTINKDTVRKRFATFNGWLIEHQALARAGKFPYKTVVLDSLTLWSDLLLKEIIRGTEGKIAQPIKGMEGNAGMQHYGLNQRYFKEYINGLLDLPCNVVITAHVTVDKDETTGKILRRPKATGQLADWLPIVFGEVYHAFVDSSGGKAAYKLQTQSDSYFNCRTQISNMPPIIETSYKNLIRK